MGVWDIQPSALIKLQGKMQFDVGALALYNQQYWGGLNFRNVDAITIYLGMYVLDNLGIGYSYDIPLSGIGRVGLGTHEIMAKYCFQIETTPRERNIIWNPRDM